ncbi:putative glycosyltransferase [Desulfocapsa sulfexigens DSM 10523]|uniref:Putative glycosyltransferase n=1 Tax=Desulfocapsa sulfexigens (strain DSM 10523 / SB164P1) TaxID=1167006 RepID=M1PH05_DESSD|nr:glycosyltransferase family 2 protein [Desulfocapsa sulfexigens]AGF78905.1 putative glycosyltransferase [Desulfocapsa sulfexigens DSM 10523]
MYRPLLCSVIIVSYNNFDTTTGPCLDSLAQSPEDMEIIVVDNNSDSSTKQLLTLAGERDSRIRLFFLDENRGYAAGNNIGARAASGEFFLLLNTDTLVPPGTISLFSSLMQQNPDWDMLGPVTNNCGNDQQIYTTGKTPEEILSQGIHWSNHSAKLSFQTDRLIFFCVLIRRTLYEELQGLDEDFGLGYYEDTDFVYRAIKSGKRMMISEKIFVYHQGKGSFSKVSGAVRKLMKKNRKLFKKKHGHGETTDHWRIKNLQAMERYLKHLNKNTPLAELQYSFSNRQRIAEELMPNSPLKRFFYRRNLIRTIARFKRRINQRQSQDSVTI